jgi:SAM-dependent methyltransferase
MTLAELLANPRFFHFTQNLNPMTVGLYRDLVSRYVVPAARTSVLDIGCGVGAHHALFSGRRYVGIDINPDYIARATKVHGRHFQVMDAGRLEFPDDDFDAAFTVATCHHLDDDTVRAMMRSALRVVGKTGAVHVIDAVLPTSSRATLKKVLFETDRGRYQRTVRALTELLARVGRIHCVDVRSGILHDVCYVRVTS